MNLTNKNPLELLRGGKARQPLVLPPFGEKIKSLGRLPLALHRSFMDTPLRTPAAILSPVVITSAELTGAEMIMDNTQIFRSGGAAIWRVTYQNKAVVPVPATIVISLDGKESSEEVTLSPNEMVNREIIATVTAPGTISGAGSVQALGGFLKDSVSKSYSVGILDYRPQPESMYPREGFDNFNYRDYGMEITKDVLISNLQETFTGGERAKDSILSVGAVDPFYGQWAEVVDEGKYRIEYSIEGGREIDGIIYRLPGQSLTITVKITVRPFFFKLNYPLEADSYKTYFHSNGGGHGYAGLLYENPNLISCFYLSETPAERTYKAGDEVSDTIAITVPNDFYGEMFTIFYTQVLGEATYYEEKTGSSYNAVIAYASWFSCFRLLPQIGRVLI